MPVEEVRELPPLDYSGFEVIADTRILDFRPWKVGRTSGRRALVGVCLSPHARPETGADRQRVRGPHPARRRSRLASACPERPRPGHPPPVLGTRRSRRRQAGPRLRGRLRSLEGARAARSWTCRSNCCCREPPPELLQSTTFYVDAETALLTCWVLLPEGKQYESFDLLRYPIGKDRQPRNASSRPTEMVSLDGQIAGVLALLERESRASRYECRWTYRD